MLNGATILVTGGTGSFGKKFITEIFKKLRPVITCFMRITLKPLMMLL